MKNKKLSNFLTSFKVGLFLAVRQIKRAHFSTNALIVFIMTLTFLNLVVVSGILVGLIEGAVRAVNERFIGDIFISNLKDKTYISRTVDIINTLDSLPHVLSYTARYTESGTVEANYKTKKRDSDLGEVVGVIMAGIDPVRENAATDLAAHLVEGEYLEPGDFDEVIIGAMLLKKYLGFDSQSFGALSDVEPGTKLRIAFGTSTHEVRVKGIVKTKVDEIDRRIFFTDAQFRSLIGRTDYNVDEIMVRLKPEVDSTAFKNLLISYGFDNYAKIQTQDDAEPKFIKDMKQTFAMLGGIISSIGLVVAAITIFIVIFINAITRRKFIGILKGIGIEPGAIEIAYVLQSLFYATLGTVFGLIIVFLLLKPYLDANPIDFPFSDGILVVTASGTIWRIVILYFATFVSGYIPARMVVKQNTLDAILGR